MPRIPLALVALLALSTAGACSKGSSAPPPLTVSPAAPVLGPLQQQQFTATVEGEPSPAVNWSVVEGLRGGTITSGGLYTAPATSGTYHVTATRVSDPSQAATATVFVVATCTLPTPQPSALPVPRVIPLGVHAVGETVAFQVPAGTGGVTLLSQGAEPAAAPFVTYQGVRLENTVVPLTVTAGGTLYFDDRVVPPDDPAVWGSPDGIGAIYFGASAPWTGTMTVPNTSHMLKHVQDQGGVPSGTWSVVVNDYAAECRAIGSPTCVVGDGVTAYPPGRYDVKAFLKPGPVAATGTIDLTFVLVTEALTEASALTDPSVVRMRETLATYLARAGLSLSTVTFVDASPEVKARYALGVNADDSGPCGDVASILRLAAPGNVMSLFLVPSFTSIDPGTVLGIDGTIPGPASVGGTVASGALASAEDLDLGKGTAACGGVPNPQDCGADETAYIVAHEMGHFLGLYHVTEWPGTLFDPVKDTPTCPCAACATTPARCLSGPITPTTYAMSTTDCTRQLTNPASVCGGGDNLMFWALGTRSAATVTAEQAAIVRANALVQ
ncbi:MAG: hypothetical protein WCS72_05425 [Deltaproteobacteria bacterium]